MRTRAFAAATIAAGLVLSGCSGSGDVTVPGTAAPTTDAQHETTEPAPTTAPEATEPAPTTTPEATEPTTPAEPEETGQAGAPGAEAGNHELLHRTVDYLWDAASYHQQGNVLTSVSTQGQEVQLEQTFAGDYVTEPLQMDMTMTQSQEAITQDIRMVLLPEGEGHRMYLSDGTSGSWVTYAMTAAQLEAEGFGSDPMNELLKNLPADSTVAYRDVPASAETNEEDAIEFTIELPAAAITEIVSSSTGGAVSSFEGTGTMVYLVAADDGQPFRSTVTIEGVMTTMGESGDFRTTNESVFSNWNEITEITVPAEAAGATEIPMP